MLLDAFFVCPQVITQMLMDRQSEPAVMLSSITLSGIELGNKTQTDMRPLHHYGSNAIYLCY